MNLKKGFTLIELLIVIAILGVMAVVALLAIDPVEQLARTRDAGRASTVSQLGRALSAFYTNSSAYPTQNNTWVTAIVTSGEVSTVPTQIGTAGCPAGSAAQNGWCYTTGTVSGTPQAIVFALTESKRNDNLCATPATQVAWQVYSTAAGRGGIVCTANATTAPANGVTAFQN